MKSLKVVSPEEQQKIDDLFFRIGDRSWQSDLSWSIIHGNFCPNNVMACNKDIFIIDFDEAGLGPIVHDLGEYLGELEQTGFKQIRAFVKGYLENEGILNDADRTAIVDGLVLQQIEAAFKNDQQDLTINHLFAGYWTLF